MHSKSDPTRNSSQITNRQSQLSQDSKNAMSRASLKIRSNLAINTNINPKALAAGINNANNYSMPATKPNVKFFTSLGEFIIELYWLHAPKTCYNFYKLCESGYYNDIIFHRIIADFMIQGGDPTGSGRGGSSIFLQPFEDEIHPALSHSGAGILSMANSGPNTNGSQFFITLAPTPHLDKKHTIFGRIKQGITVVQKLGLVATDEGDRPKEEIKIIKSELAD
jgi:peptidyl-prolyl cis-trans isomerase-like 1